jgi:hypothetical protein
LVISKLTQHEARHGAKGLFDSTSRFATESGARYPERSLRMTASCVPTLSLRDKGGASNSLISGG